MLKIINMLRARRRAYELSGRRIKDANKSLLFKGRHGSALNRKNNGGAHNRYERLLFKINDQLPNTELKNEDKYPIKLSWLDKRNLCVALRYVIAKQEEILYILEEQEIIDDSIMTSGRIMRRNLIPETCEIVKRCLAELALRNSFFLSELDLKPRNNPMLFRLPDIT